MRIGLAADHGGFALKQKLLAQLGSAGFQAVDYGAHQLEPGDDYPDFIIPLAQALAKGELARGVAICGSGVGACVAANKVPGVRACLIQDYYSAHQGVEHDDLNFLCLGGEVIGELLAWDLVMAFLNAHYSGEERHQRRLDKIAALEQSDYPRQSTGAPEITQGLHNGPSPS
jgi:ribose 5-phosphate isomerase B